MFKAVMECLISKTSDAPRRQGRAFSAPAGKLPPVKRLCHNYYQQNHDFSDSSVTNYFLNLGVKPLQKLALKVPVLNCDTASKGVV